MQGMTNDVLQAIWKRVQGDPLRSVEVLALATNLRLTSEEVCSALRALEVTGLVRYEGPSTAPTTVRLTARGAAQGAEG